MTKGNGNKWNKSRPRKELSSWGSGDWELEVGGWRQEDQVEML